MTYIFIIAPYTSIIDQNAENIRKVLETRKVAMGKNCFGMPFEFIA